MHTGFLGSWIANSLNERVLERISYVLQAAKDKGRDLSKFKVRPNGLSLHCSMGASGSVMRHRLTVWTTKVKATLEV